MHKQPAMQYRFFNSVRIVHYAIVVSKDERGGIVVY